MKINHFLAALMIFTVVMAALSVLDLYLFIQLVKYDLPKLLYGIAGYICALVSIPVYSLMKKRLTRSVTEKS